MKAGDSSISGDDAAAEVNEDELFKPKSKTSTTNLLLRCEEEKIYSPFLSSNSPPSNPHGWSMVIIKDNPQQQREDWSSLIFPPIHHENLQLVGKPPTLSNSSSASSSGSDLLSEIDDGSHEDSSSSSSSSSTILLSPVDPDSDSPARRREWVNLGLEVLRSKVRGLFGWFHYPVKLSAFTTAAAALVVGFLYFRWRRRRPSLRVEHGDGDRLVRIIREKDERINELLNQIARLNDVLLALQRVPAAGAPPKTL